MNKDKNTLIGKYLSGNANKAEEKEILDWVKQDPENEKEFDRLKEFWNISVNLKTTRLLDADKAWDDFKFITQSEPQPLLEKSRFSALKIAAAITLFTVLFFLVKFFISNHANDVSERENSIVQITNNKDQNIKYITYSTTDSAIVFLLPDSSSIHLNKRSKLVCPEKFNPSERSVSLNGEAFFEIKHNSIPFVIFCKQTKTFVMGTSFNIKGNENDKKVTVTVVTGTVQFSDQADRGSEKLILTENERGTFEVENTHLSKTKNTDKDFAWWKKIHFKTKIKKFIKKLKQRI